MLPCMGDAMDRGGNLQKAPAQESQRGSGSLQMECPHCHQVIHLCIRTAQTATEKSRVPSDAMTAPAAMTALTAEELARMREERKEAHRREVRRASGFHDETSIEQSMHRLLGVIALAVLVVAGAYGAFAWFITPKKQPPPATVPPSRSVERTSTRSPLLPGKIDGREYLKKARQYSADPDAEKLSELMKTLVPPPDDDTPEPQPAGGDL